MKTVFTIFLLLSSFAFGQNNRFIYEVDYRKDSAETYSTKEFYHLDVKNDKVKYYSKVYFVLDSLMRNNLPMSMPEQPSMTNVAVLDRKSGIYSEFIPLEYEILKLNEKPVQSWKLLNETKTYAGLKTQKAVTNWGGRYWEAWFTKEIPLNFGPYKFAGLPGLIVELADSKGNYNFRLVKSEKFEHGEVKTIDTFPTVATATYEQLRKKKLSTYEDPLAFLNTTDANFKDANSEGIYLNDGTMVTKENIRDVRQQQRLKIKKYNNPIELDKVIHYPEK